ncbi:hypothetical protein [Amycolatopsis sp. H20-H5]|uniref:hypothetical protein n=1 Tax=Amycolatopsis sp. H20-H5 TaxID=3046309 RepID=UPI002DBDF45B|nr:hypothetical protein [Amycolatopsis sp. H20-H5]MEC3976818.1 hypothetical protein [Amycolatopsis sp. H20-H5]
MEQTRCPRCGCPLAELTRTAAVPHSVAHGTLDYLRCVCGSWLARVNGVVVSATQARRG